MNDWLARFDHSGPWAPFWLALSIAVGFLLLRYAFDGLFLAIWGFPPDLYPFWRSELWWPEIVNVSLIGYVPAALVILRRGTTRDLQQLRVRLPGSDAEVDAICAAAAGPAGFTGRAFMLLGFVLGILLVFADPSSVSRGAELSVTNPAFMWALLRIPVFIWLIFVLIVSDLNTTRSYLRIGRDLIEVDLLDIQSLSPFARRGLRSALTWVIFLMIFSLFWLGEGTASSQNVHLVHMVLAMATVGFVVPLLGVHTNILSAKQLELDRLRDRIRAERTTVVDKPSDENSMDDSPANLRLANLIAYYQLIDRTREWPIGAANLFRFFMYLLIGLGSWLGAAVVERLLDSTLGA
jgi:hypothetical protein